MHLGLLNEIKSKGGSANSETEEDKKSERLKKIELLQENLDKKFAEREGLKSNRVQSRSSSDRESIPEQPCPANATESQHNHKTEAVPQAAPKKADASFFDRKADTFMSSNDIKKMKSLWEDKSKKDRDDVVAKSPQDTQISYRSYKRRRDIFNNDSNNNEDNQTSQPATKSVAQVSEEIYQCQLRERELKFLHGINDSPQEAKNDDQQLLESIASAQSNKSQSTVERLNDEMERIRLAENELKSHGKLLTLSDERVPETAANELLSRVKQEDFASVFKGTGHSDYSHVDIHRETEEYRLRELETRERCGVVDSNVVEESLNPTDKIAYFNKMLEAQSKQAKLQIAPDNTKKIRRQFELLKHKR